MTTIKFTKMQGLGNDFVVLDYENGKKNYLTEERVEDLHNCGIEVVNLNKEFNDVLKTDEYRNSKETDTFRHPNEKARDLILLPKTWMPLA